MQGADFIIIGGGVAGLSAGAALAAHGRVLLLEAEEATGYHSSGRSVTFSHYGIGNHIVRALTCHSRGFFLDPPEGFTEVPLCRITPALFAADEAMLPGLDALEAITRGLTDEVERLDAAGMLALCPVVRTDRLVAGIVDRSGLKLDPHAMLQGFTRAIRRGSGEVLTGRRVARVDRSGERWRVATDAGETFEAPVLVNAAGSWADRIASLAGVKPLGLCPLRRSIIVFDPPAGMDVRGWPFLKTVADEFYMLPDAGRLLASPVDEVPDDPCDAQPEEYDSALAAHRVSEFTTLEVKRIAHRWAGLRTFTADRVPVAGFDPQAPGFFWLAGQGGYGLQTAPAMAEIVAALITGGDWPAPVPKDAVTVERLRD